MRYFDDFKVGDTFDCGSKTFSKKEIIEFARQFDPQPFHVDEEQAARSQFGGLIASGWHTCAASMRLIVDNMRNASMGSPGVDSIRWLKPVRPGDTLHLRATVLEIEPSKSRPDRGRVRMRYEMLDLAGEPVMSMSAVGIIRRRTAEGA
jgi:acyl dehydratase